MLKQQSYAASLEHTIETKAATVGIVGLGYVGLPLAKAFVESGFRTIGFDVDPEKIEALQLGTSYVNHIDSTQIQRWVHEQTFVPTTDLTRLVEPDVILICVPTPLNDARDPDLQHVEATATAISKELRPGQLIILESTTYPGTTRDVLVPHLENNGLQLGTDFFVAYSPEREDPGNPEHSAQRIPKVVGGIDSTSLDLAVCFYRHAVPEVVPVSSCEVAEACKILENTYRSVNIAMVNEMKMLFERLDVDIWEVIEAAKTKPFGFQAFYPGPGLGGHCIPIDPFYLAWLARKHGASTRFIELAGEINSAMPNYVVAKLTEALNSRSKPLKGSRILILGVAYKKDIDDPRESPAFPLFDELLRQGAEVRYHDPYIARLPKMRRYRFLPRLECTELSPETLADQDCVVIITDHSVYDFEEIVEHSQLVVDTRNATRARNYNSTKIWKA